MAGGLCQETHATWLHSHSNRFHLPTKEFSGCSTAQRQLLAIATKHTRVVLECTGGSKNSNPILRLKVLDSMEFASRIHGRKQFPKGLMKLRREVPLDGMPHELHTGAAMRKLFGGMPITTHRHNLGALMDSVFSVRRSVDV